MYNEQWKTVTPVAQRNCTARKLVGILEKVEDEEDGMAKENHREYDYGSGRDHSHGSVTNIFVCEILLGFDMHEMGGH